MKKIYFLFALTASFMGVSAQISMINNNSYTQLFNTLPTSGSATWTDNSTIANWYAQRSGTGTTIVADNGGNNAGNLYSYGTGTDAERALGSVGSGGAGAGNFAWGVLLRNMSGGTITDIKITYTGEQWRMAGNTAQTLSFYYKISSSTITALQPNTNATWTNVAALNFTSPTLGTPGAGIDGNASANRITFTNIAIPSITLNDGDYIMLKWDDPDHPSNDHGFAIDDVTITWTAGAAGPLPVKFGNLKATQTSVGINLQWSNLTESDMIHYTLERSANGRNFTSVASLNPSSNNGGKADYQYLDASPLTGTSFYRIKAEERSGKVTYSDIARISIGAGNTLLNLYPNPVKGNILGLQINNLPSGKYMINIYNSSANRVSSQSLDHNGGSVSQTISLNNLKPGMYTFEISGAIKMQKQFVVQ